MRYEIIFDDLAAEEVAELRAYDRQGLLDAIEEQLRYQPTILTRRRKPLPTLSPSFHHVPPIWQIRVGEFRVFYDVDEDGGAVHVRAVRRKKPEMRTEDIV